jgi:hypothetical protein
MLLSGAFHKNASSQFIERLGYVFDAWGAYFLFRCFCRTWDEATWVCRLTGIILAPIAVSMIVEKVTTHNFFAIFGGVPEISHIREGHLRAQGPFAHAILAGTVGAVCLPLVLSVWKLHKSSAVIGTAACLAMVIASGSSGPILSAAAAIGALALWPYRDSMRSIRWGAVAGYIALDLIMKDPAYFIMARIDLTGGSTGWFRARLIQSSLEHISEWWLSGTDYTRHWMPSGVSWSPEHTDLTDHYVYMGVLGGLPLLIMFIALVAQGFAVVGRRLQNSPKETQFASWAFGASLFAHAVTCISVSYFDSSVVFLYLTLGLIGSPTATAVATAVPSPRIVPQDRLGSRPARSASQPQPISRSPGRSVQLPPPIETSRRAMRGNRR